MLTPSYVFPALFVHMILIMVLLGNIGRHFYNKYYYYSYSPVEKEKLLNRVLKRRWWHEFNIFKFVLLFFFTLLMYNANSPHQTIFAACYTLSILFWIIGYYYAEKYFIVFYQTNLNN